MATYNPTYYGNRTDIELAKQNGLAGNFVDLSTYGDDNNKYNAILQAYKNGTSPIVLGGTQAVGGVNDGLYNRLLDSGVSSLTRVSGADRNQTQQALKDYVSNQQRNQQFQFDYKPLSYQDATKQVQDQLQPLYQKALDNIKSQKYQDSLNADQQSVSRGLSHSGLAADLQNKVALNASNQMADATTQNNTKTAEMAQALMQQDKNNEAQQRQQAYNEYAQNKQMVLNQDQFNYQKQQAAQEKAWREYTYNNMSAAEKAQMEWAKQQYGEDAAWKMYQLNYNGELQKAANQAQINAYNSLGFKSGGGGGDYSASPQSFQSNMNKAIQRGVPAEWAPLLSEIVKRESSYNPKAQNPKSTAYGYGQFLASTRKQYEAKTGLSYDDPVNQLIMMAQYVKDRYQTPQNALAFWNKNHWY